MAARRSFKSDQSFLEKLSMGAAGTTKVHEDLRGQGHAPIELERGSQSSKLWKNIKFKGIRVPDVLCTRCGLKFESRAKTKLDISMSHSQADPERSWDFELGDEDFVALVVCERKGDRPIDWEADEMVQYVRVRDLRTAHDQGRAISVRPKGAQEGFEARVSWPAAVANYDGTVAEVGDERLQYVRASDGRTITLKLRRRGIQLHPRVQEGETVRKNQMVASVVPVTRRVHCDGGLSRAHLIKGLASMARTTRYASAKALSHFPSEEARQALLRRLADEQEEFLVKLEAAASLARLGVADGFSFIESAVGDKQYANRLEAVVVLREIGGKLAEELLMKVLADEGQPAEIRSGAAWSLGELRAPAAIDDLVNALRTEHELVRVEAARALAKIGREHSTRVMKEFSTADETTHPGLAWALSKADEFALEEVLDALVDDDARRWAAFILGSSGRGLSADEIERLKEGDPEVYFAMTVLRKVFSSWVFGLEEFG